MMAVTVPYRSRTGHCVGFVLAQDDLDGVVTRTLEPAHVSIWISRPG
jgi:hypothetical protein